MLDSFFVGSMIGNAVSPMSNPSKCFACESTGFVVISIVGFQISASSMYSFHSHFCASSCFFVRPSMTTQNITAVIDREGAINDLMDKTEIMVNKTDDFRIKTKTLSELRLACHVSFS